MPIGKELAISDAGMGLLIGIGFSLFYALVSLPAGALVDRGGRRGLLSGAVAIWSIMTIFCGLSGSFLHLLGSRVGLGIAEGVIVPASYSLIRERVPSRMQGRAFSLFSAAPYLGGSLALMIGGALAAAKGPSGHSTIPLLHFLTPWRATLVVLGVFGMTCAFLPALVDRDARKTRIAPSAPSGFRDALAYMIEHRRFYLPLIIYTTLSAAVVFANGPWLPTLMMRKFGLSVDRVGLSYGLVKIAAAPVGLALVGFLLDRSARDGGIARAGATMLILTLIAFAMVPFAPTPNSMLAFKGVGLLFSGAYAAVGAMLLLRATPAELLGKVTVIYLFFQTVFGTGLGPLAVGALSGLMEDGATLAIGKGMFITTVVLGIPAAASAFLITDCSPSTFRPSTGISG